MANTSRAGALRRYPALAYLAGAVALALLLPSGLNVPNSGPSSLAEYAPVPGQSNAPSDLSQVGQASSSGGPGFGGGGQGGGGGPTTVPGAPEQGARGIVRKAGKKRCVGSPPRQTEDPLSPPCVAIFEGDNFGATAKGVTRDEIRVVVFAQNSTGSTSPFDCGGTITASNVTDEVACHAYQAFFNNRYQMYGRRPHIIIFRFIGGNIEASVAEADARFSPFAMIVTEPNGSTADAQSASRHSIVALTKAGFYRHIYTDVPSYVMSFRQDSEDHAHLAASFVCAKLAGRPPHFNGPTEPKSGARVFGYMSISPLIKNEIKAQCNVSPAAEGSSYTAGPSEVSRLHAAGVTTVVIDAPLGNAIEVATSATQIGWFPEWVILGQTGLNGLDTNGPAREIPAAQWSHAVGMTLDYRRDANTDQPWYSAYREGCPDCPSPSNDDAANLYDSMSLLFYGIQAAGPRLTAANIDKGLHAIPPATSTNPYRPSAYFGPGNYSFVKDATAIWWDPQGRAPGDTQPGCYRLVDDGRRRRFGEWVPGDADLENPNQAPCQGSIRPS